MAAQVKVDDACCRVPTTTQIIAVDLAGVEYAFVIAVRADHQEVGIPLREIPEVLKADVRTHVTGTAGVGPGAVCRGSRSADPRWLEPVRGQLFHASVHRAWLCLLAPTQGR